jgi:hypothetical protein
MARQPLLNCRKSGKGRGFAGADQIGGAVEAVPFNRSYVKNDYEVAFSPPDLLSPAVEDLETPVHDLENVAGQRSVTVGDVHRNDVRGSQLPGKVRGDFDRHGAVHEHAALVLHGMKQAGIRATGANGEDHVALPMEGDGFACGKIGGDHTQWDLHLLEAVTFQEAFEKSLHALAGGESHPTQAPAADIGEAHGGTDAGYFLGRRAAGVSRCHDRARAYTRDAVNGNLMLFESLQQPGVGDATGEPTPKRDTDFGLQRGDRRNQLAPLARKVERRGGAEAANSTSSFPDRYNRLQHSGSTRLPGQGGPS